MIYNDKPRKARLALILATWAIALVVTFPHPAGLLWIWMFPAGLKTAFTKTPPDVADGILGWILYVGLLFWAAKAEKRWAFILAYIVLCIVLVVNVGGCRQFHHGLNDLH